MRRSDSEKPGTLCTRRDVMAALGATCAFGLQGGAATAARGPRTDALDAPVVEGPLGARLHDYLSRASAFGLAGTVLVAVEDQVVLHQGYGLADLGRRRPNNVRTLYDVGSTTKTMTAGAILLLESQGRLAVGDTLSRHFDNVPEDKAGIRLAHLLTHTSGIVDPPLSDYAPIGRDELARIVFASALGGRPGTVYNYSNSGFSLLAAIVEKVTGTSYEAFMRQRLFAPAGMTTMGYRLPGRDPRRVAHTYTYPVDHGSPLERLRAADGPGWVLMGNGGLIGTAADLYRWERFFRSGAVIPAEQARRATTPQYWRSPRAAIGFDWEIEAGGPGEGAYGHGSDAPFAGLNGWIGYDPARRTSIAWLANNRLNGASSRRFAVPNVRRMLRGEPVPLPPRPGAVTAAALRRAEGLFAGEGSTIAVRAAQDCLEVGANGAAAVELFNARQGDAAVAEARALDARAELFHQALARQDPAALAEYVGSPAGTAALLDSWRAALAARGPLQGSSVLGTFRLDRPAYVTTVRFDFAGAPATARFGWQDGRLAPSREDLLLEALAGPMMLSPVPYAAWQPFWYPEAGALFTFDLVTGTRRELKAVEREGRIAELRFERPDGRVSRWIRRESPAGRP